MDKIALLPSTLSDLSLLRMWDAKAHVIAATGPRGGLEWETELPRAVAWRELLITEQDGHAVAVLQIIDPALEETHYWGDVGPDLRAIDMAGIRLRRSAHVRGRRLLRVPA
jgi:aminoglycoside 6'-N-acetyltransferase